MFFSTKIMGLLSVRQLESAHREGLPAMAVMLALWPSEGLGAFVVPFRAKAGTC
jgi:hypothetical protein